MLQISGTRFFRKVSISRSGLVGWLQLTKMTTSSSQGSSSKLDFKSSLPVDLIKRLKEAEGELDEAKERLDKAAFHHDKHANEYM